MKKIMISLISILLILAISLVLYEKMFKVEKPLYTKIHTKDLKQMKEENKDFTLYLYQENCAGCKRMKPIINKYIKKNNQKVYAIDVNNSDDVKYLADKVKIKKTPTIIFYKKGKEVEREVGQLTKEQLKRKSTTQ